VCPQKLPPFDWERDRDVYYKHHSVFWPNVHGTNIYHRRLADLEQLQVVQRAPRPAHMLARTG
jgi:hypothetical protein